MTAGCVVSRPVKSTDVEACRVWLRSATQRTTDNLPVLQCNSVMLILLLLVLILLPLPLPLRLLGRQTHIRFTASFPGQLGHAGTRKVKPIWILMKREITE